MSSEAKKIPANTVAAINAQEWQPSFNPWLIAISVMLATFMEVLDTSVANVALPHIAGNLSASTDQATWVLTSYLVSNAIVLPATGWLSAMIRAQATSDLLHNRVYSFVAVVRRGDQPQHVDHRARHSRRGRRSFAANRAGYDAGKLSPAKSAEWRWPSTAWASS